MGNEKPRYDPGSTAHRVLTVLLAGPLSMGGITARVAATDPEVRARRIRKSRFAVMDLSKDGYIFDDSRTYAITPKGLAELDLLGPLVIRTPNVRAFEPGSTTEKEPT